MRLIERLSAQKKAITEIASIFVVSRLLILAMGYLSHLILRKERWYRVPSSVLDSFFIWDSQWYHSVAVNGYSYTPGKMSNVGFFPLYPLLVRAVSFITGNPKIVGFAISNIALLIAVIYFYRLIMHDLDDSSVASRAVFYLLVSPVSFFFSIFYTEGLFLALAVSAFYYARRRRWLVASVLGYFLSLTRSIGVLIMIPLLVELADIRSATTKPAVRIRDVLYLLLIPAGLLTHMGYLYFRFNDALLYAHAQFSWCRYFTSFFDTLSNTECYRAFDKTIYLGAVIVAALLICYLLVNSKVRLSYVVYSALLLFVYLSSRLLEGMPRYVGIVFPLYLGMALLAERSRWMEYLLSIASIMLLSLFTALFVNGYVMN